MITLIESNLRNGDLQFSNNHSCDSDYDTIDDCQDATCNQDGAYNQDSSYNNAYECGENGSPRDSD